MALSGLNETFFEPTRIWLFGKVFDSLKYRPTTGEFKKDYVAPKGADETLPMPPKRLERTLRRNLRVGMNGEVDDNQEPQFFARIYSFSYEAHFYRLPRPLLFLVNSEGETVGGERRPKGTDSAAGTSGAAQAGDRPFPFSVRHTGLDARDWDFSDDIKVWKVDRKDLAVCLDVEIGNYQELLLDSMVASERRDEERATRSRGDVVGRGAGSFRGDMIGPHQNK